MRKLIALLVLSLMPESFYAQSKMMSIDRNATFSGSVYAVVKDKDVSEKTAVISDEGTKFFLENKRIGAGNYITFWMENREGERYDLNSWRDNNSEIILHIDKSGKQTYCIRDDTFNYLLVSELFKGKFVVKLFTEIRTIQ